MRCLVSSFENLYKNGCARTGIPPASRINLKQSFGQKMVLEHNIYTFHQDIWKKPDPWEEQMPSEIKVLAK